MLQLEHCVPGKMVIGIYREGRGASYQLIKLSNAVVMQ